MYVGEQLPQAQNRQNGDPESGAGAGIFDKFPPNRRQTTGQRLSITEKRDPAGPETPAGKYQSPQAQPNLRSRNPNDHPESQHNQLPPVPWTRCPPPPSSHRPLSPAVRVTDNRLGENLYTKQCTERRFVAAQVVQRPERGLKCPKTALREDCGPFQRRAYTPHHCLHPDEKSQGPGRAVVPTTPDPTVAQASFSQSTSRRETGVVIKGHDAAAFPGCGCSLVI